MIKPNSPNLDYQPLAARARPRNFREFIGQSHIVGMDKPLRMAIEQDQLSSLILWGPPGCGKTSLAYLIANLTNSHFEYLSAVSATIDDLRKIIKAAKNRLHPDSSSLLTKQTIKPKRTILTIDEVHRWNRSQQATLLPYVEDGTIIFIGCTTENPYFEVISPLLSRATVYKLEALNDKEIIKILKNALKANKNNLKLNKNFRLDNKTLDYISRFSNGDARLALNILEAALNYMNKQLTSKLSMKIVASIIQSRSYLYDKKQDAHYDTISAFIKSMRGSDPDAALFYLAKMLAGGEDPKFIARRIFILASEDIGNADPHAINVAASAFEAVEKIGLPEAELSLAQATIYMACAPKSNAAYKAISAAKKDLKQKGAGEVPLFLRNAAHSGLKNHQYGEGYQYPHDLKDAYAPIEYLPSHLKGSKYYYPSERGYEKVIKARLAYWRSLKKIKRVDK